VKNDEFDLDLGGWVKRRKKISAFADESWPDEQLWIGKQRKDE
jgi:hypothetical protein